MRPFPLTTFKSLIWVFFTSTKPLIWRHFLHKKLIFYFFSSVIIINTTLKICFRNLFIKTWKKGDFTFLNKSRGLYKLPLSSFLFCSNLLCQVQVLSTGKLSQMLFFYQLKKLLLVFTKPLWKHTTSKFCLVVHQQAVLFPNNFPYFS